MKLLLTSVFAPFAVDDEYGEKENKMELFHNQVTREQGIFSYRFNHASHGLYFIASNVNVPTTVLDFPTVERFKKELKNGYDYVGISFIIPNFKKAKKMAEIVREFAPKTKIILGGHGVNTPNIEQIIEHDIIARGEGIAFFRKLFNEEVDRPIKHPLTYSSFNREVMGVPWRSDAGILITGVGCANKCRFCATSHFFGEYTPYLKTGAEIYNVCCEYEDKMGISDFGVLDENFLKYPQRAMELLQIMEANNRFFSFSIFSSAETLTSLTDLDILVRMGVKFIWVGVESKKEVYEKNKGVNFMHLFGELKKRGIAIMASAILFLEEHDQNTIWDDITFATSLNVDYLQFMQLGPIPGTTLYKNYEEEGKLIADVPLMTQHGQKKIWFNHPHFTPEDSEKFIKEAFRFDYVKNGASLIRAIKTSLQGYEYCLNHSNPLVKNRTKEFKSILKMMRFFLFSAKRFSQNQATTNLIEEIKKEYTRLLGRPSPLLFLMSSVVMLFAVKEYLRIRFISDVRQPKTLYERYNYQNKLLTKNQKIEQPKLMSVNYHPNLVKDLTQEHSHH